MWSRIDSRLCLCDLICKPNDAKILFYFNFAIKLVQRAVTSLLENHIFSLYEYRNSRNRNTLNVKNVGADAEKQKVKARHVLLCGNKSRRAIPWLFHGITTYTYTHSHTHTHDLCRANQKMSLIFHSPQMLSILQYTYVTLNLFTVAHIQTRCHTRFQLFNFWLFSVQQNRTKINVKPAVATHI